MKFEQIKEIKEQYPHLQKWSDNYAYNIYQYIEEQQIIKEFLSTIEVNRTVKDLINRFGENIRVDFEADKNDVIYRIQITFNGQLKEHLYEVNKFMDSYGWYPSFVHKGYLFFQYRKLESENKEVLEKFGIHITYEAKYDVKADVSNIPYFYHITPDIKYPKIKLFGLTPKTQGKLVDHPGRIYLLSNLESLEENGMDLESFAEALLTTYSNRSKVKEMYVLKIDASKLKNMEFFEDPNFLIGDAVWTYKNIPPSAIELIEQIPIQKDDNTIK